MDITSFVGPIWGITAILVGLVLEGGHISSIIQFTAFLIVLGGTSGSIMVAYPLRDLIGAVKSLGIFFKGQSVTPEDLKVEILELANIARAESVLALEKRQDSIEYPVLQIAIRLAVDGTEAHIVRETLETGQHIAHEEKEVYTHFWEDCGAIAPTIGILGAVLGLIHVMENLDKPELIGPGIAIAFVATLYGVGSANIFFIPMAKKIKRKAGMESLLHDMVITGTEGIMTGINPKVLEEKLNMYTG
ncbi:MAG: MotA/TolQ/ExbB proton channel family protein [Zetaproteobacteria bacterium]|nr:MotA/TolQ/ExbB proton channel family protein [Zetaproteobacteria bacterium]